MFVHRKLPARLHDLRPLHLCALFGKQDWAEYLVGLGADMNAVGSEGELAFGIVLQRDKEPEVRFWAKRFGPGLLAPPEEWVKRLADKIRTDTAVAELMMDNAIIDIPHEAIDPNRERSLALLPISAPRTALLATNPLGRYTKRPAPPRVDCSLMLAAKQLDELLPTRLGGQQFDALLPVRMGERMRQSLGNVLSFVLRHRSVMMARPYVRACIQRGICCPEVVPSFPGMHVLHVACCTCTSRGVMCAVRLAGGAVIRGNASLGGRSTPRARVDKRSGRGGVESVRASLSS